MNKSIKIPCIQHFYEINSIFRMTKTRQRDQVKNKLSIVWGWIYVHHINLHLLDNVVVSKYFLRFRMCINLTCNIFERSVFIFNGCFLKIRTMISIAIYPCCKWHILSVLSKQIHNAFNQVTLDHAVNQHWNIIYQYPFPVSFAKIIN